MQKSCSRIYRWAGCYEDIVNVCPAYGKKVAIIGGKRALAAPRIRF